MFKYLLFIVLFFGELAHAQTVRTIGADYIDGNNSGFRNYAVNPYMDKNLAGITCTSFATCALTTTEKLQGTQSLSLTATSASGTVKFRAKAFDRELYGQNCEFSIDVFTSASVVPHYDVYLENNGTQVSGTTTAMVSQTDQTKRYSVFAPCGSSTSGPYDLVIDSNNTTGTNIKVDNFYAGLNRNIGTVSSGMQYVGKVTWSNTTTTFNYWTISSPSQTTYTTFPDNASCGTPTATGGVSVLPGASKELGLTINTQPGRYIFKIRNAQLVYTDSGNSSQNYFINVTDGTSFGLEWNHAIRDNSQEAYWDSMEIPFDVTDGGVKNFKYAGRFSTSNPMRFACTGGTSTNILQQPTVEVYYIPNQNQIVTRMDQSGIFSTFVGKISMAPTAGCTFNNTGTFANYSANGTCPTVSATGGVTSPAKRPAVTITNPKRGTYAFNIVGELIIGGSGVCAMRFYDGTNASSRGAVSGVGSGQEQSTFTSQIEYTSDPTGPITVDFQMQLGAGSTCQIQAVNSDIAIEVYYYPPRDSSMNMPILVGGVTTLFQGNLLIQTANVTNNGTTCAVAANGPAWTSACARNSTGNITITPSAGVFSQIFFCSFSPYTSNAIFQRFVGAPSTSAVQIVTLNAASFPNNLDSDGHLLCMGSR